MPATSTVPSGAPPGPEVAPRPLAAPTATLRTARGTAAHTRHVAAVAGARGVPKSGRAWKRVQHKKFSTVRTDGTKELTSSWAKKEAKRTKARRVKELERELRQQRVDRAQQKRDAAAEREKRRAENELKNTTYHVIKEGATIKRMNKKQLRQLKKTEFGADGVVRLVPAFGGGQRRKEVDRIIGDGSYRPKKKRKSTRAGAHGSSYRERGGRR